MVYILTGDIQTGKSHALNNWGGNKTNVVGLLSLSNNEGKRLFVDIRNNECFSMHAIENEDEENKVLVGKFIFSKLSFERANSIINFEMQQTDYKYFIVDELGKLELRHDGLYTSTHNLATKFEDKTNQHLILVVRSGLLENVIKTYNFKKYKILDKEALKLI
ncbi:MAG: thioredoxin family protein [Flavobacteriaceae bacterium]|nr:thioredoxin family protein [Flavobacteriaceae bacterium]